MDNMMLCCPLKCLSIFPTLSPRIQDIHSALKAGGIAIITEDFGDLRATFLLI